MKRVHKFISLLLVFVLTISSMLFNSVMAADTVTFTAKIDNKSVKIGDELHCLVDISNNTGWGSITLKLNYNKDVIEFVSATNGSAIGSASGSNNDNSGYYTIALFLGDANVLANGTLVDIVFKAVGVGTSELTFDKETADIETVDFDIVKCNFIDGTVTVNDNTTSSSTTTTEVTTTTTTAVCVVEKPTTTTTKTTVASDRSTEATTTTITTTTKATTKPTTTTTKATTTTTEVTTETTTVKKSTSSGGGSSRSNKSTTKTTTTEATTSATENDTEATTQATTKTTTQSSSKTQTDNADTVKVSIGSNKVTIGGKVYDMDVAPYIQTKSMSTMVPLRFAALAIMGDYDSDNKIMWDANTKTVTLLYATDSDQKTIQFTAGSSNMVIDGKTVAIENGVVAEITDGRMFIPFRALGTAMGVDVSWDNETKTAIFNAK